MSLKRRSNNDVVNIQEDSKTSSNFSSPLNSMKTLISSESNSSNSFSNPNMTSLQLLNLHGNNNENHAFQTGGTPQNYQQQQTQPQQQQPQSNSISSAKKRKLDHSETPSFITSTPQPQQKTPKTHSNSTASLLYSPQQQFVPKHISFDDSPSHNNKQNLTNASLSSSSSSSSNSSQSQTQLDSLKEESLSRKGSQVLNLFSPMFHKLFGAKEDQNPSSQPSRSASKTSITPNTTQDESRLLAIEPNLESTSSSDESTQPATEENEENEEESTKTQQQQQQQQQQTQIIHFHHHNARQLENLQKELEQEQDAASSSDEVAPEEVIPHQQQRQQIVSQCDEDVEEEEEEDLDAADVFDPYTFIATLWKDTNTIIKPLSNKLLPDRKPEEITSKSNTLVLDLDETLVHCSVEPMPQYDFTFPVLFNDLRYLVYVRCRPGYAEFLQQVSQMFEVVVFTASQEVYAKTLLDRLDTKKSIQHRLYRESCVSVDGNFLKDLSFINRDLSRTVIVDNSPQAFAYQIENGIPIKSFFDDANDCELANLLPFLKTLSTAKDVRPLLRERFHLQEKVEKARQDALQFA